jgi:hypothetical protein
MDYNNQIYELKPSHFPSNWKQSDNPHKPILRPLSDMTEEEKLEFYKLVNPNSIEDSDSVRIDTIDEIIKGHLFPLKLLEIAMGAAYLLSRSFDLFGLIEDNEAIDATTLPNNPYKNI